MPTVPLGSNPGQTTPITSDGDLIVGNADGEATRLPIGESGQVLTVQPSTHLLGEDCILCLPLRANATDVGPNAFAVTNHGTVTFDATNGASFNGTNQWLSIADAAALNPTGDMSISLFASVVDIPLAGSFPLVNKVNYDTFDPAGYDVSAFSADGVLSNISVSLGTFGTTGTADIPESTLVGITATYRVSDGSVRLYINGALVAENTSDQSILAATDLDLLLGKFNADPLSSYSLLKGTERDVFIAGREFSLADHVAWYNGGSGHSDGGLTVAVNDETGLTAEWADLPGGGGGGGGETGVPGSQLISGGGFTYLGLLQFRGSAAQASIVGVTYDYPETDLTLDAADGTHPRIDIFVYTNAGTIAIIKGTAAANPAVPTYDPGTQLYAGYSVTIPALATTIPGATNTLVYDELGTAPEFELTTSGSGWTALSTVNPLTGTKDLLATAVAAGGYAKFAPAAPIDLATYAGGILSLPVRVVTAWQGKRGLAVQFYSGTATVGIQVNILNGSFAFDASITSAYQTLAIPLSTFQIPAGTTFDSFRVIVTGGAISFRLDNVRLQGNAVGSGLTLTQLDARYAQRANNLSDMAAVATARANLIVKRPWFNLIFCSAFTPSGTGVDDAKFEVPYDPDDGVSSITWTVRRIWGVLKTGGGTPDIVIEKLDGTDIGTLTFGSGATTAAKTSSFDLTTLVSGDIIQMNFTDLGTAVGFNIGIMCEKAS